MYLHTKADLINASIARIEKATTALVTAYGTDNAAGLHAALEISENIEDVISDLGVITPAD